MASGIRYGTMRGTTSSTCGTRAVQCAVQQAVVLSHNATLDRNMCLSLSCMPCAKLMITCGSKTPHNDSL
eukprot:351025-Chlamydomonas_euryale.AAC.7